MNLQKSMDKLPFIMDWVLYKNEKVVANFNLEATLKANKPMFDISYCMTKAFNGIVLKTVQYDKNKFATTH